MYLCIASRDRYHFDVILFNEQSRHDNGGREAPSLLEAVDDFLAENGLTKEDVDGILVVVGNGTFSTVRAGTVLANAWSVVKKIPVMAISPEQMNNVQSLIPQLQQHDGLVLPEYNGEPNIRIKKVAE